MRILCLGTWERVIFNMPQSYFNTHLTEFCIALAVALATKADQPSPCEAPWSSYKVPSATGPHVRKVIRIV